MGILRKLFGKKELIDSKAKTEQIHQSTSETSFDLTSNVKMSWPITKSFYLPEAVWPNFVPNRIRRDFIELDTDAVSLYPSLQGDYAKTVFLMMYIKGAIPVSRPAPQYLLYECGIKDLIAYRKSAVDDGFLVEPDSEAILSGMKLADIKTVCKSLGIIQTGVKSAIIKRILSEADPSELVKRLPSEKSYMLSEKGETYLQKHVGYQILHRNRKWSISWEEYDQQHKENETPYETMLRIVQACLDKEPFNLVRNDYYALSEIYEQSGDITISTEMLLYVQYLDLSGMCLYDQIQFYHKNSALAKEKTTVNNRWINDLADSYAYTTFAPGVVEQIAKRKEIITPELMRRVTEWWLPVNVCSATDFRRIINEICENKFDVAKEETEFKAKFIKAIR